MTDQQPIIPADYSRCMGISCAIKDNCARHRDIPDNVRISWVRTMIDVQVPGCAAFIPWQAEARIHHPSSTGATL
jgi:hypothetical protein